MDTDSPQASDQESPILHSSVNTQENETTATSGTEYGDTGIENDTVLTGTEYEDTEIENGPTDIVDLSTSSSSTLESSLETEPESSITETPVLCGSEEPVSEEPVSESAASNDISSKQEPKSVVSTFTFDSDSNRSTPVSTNRSTPSNTHTSSPSNRIATKTTTTKSSLNTRPRQTEVPLTQTVKFDLEAVARRLEAGQVSREREDAGGRCFRAKITPTSNKDAESELRREIR